jgi:hypothetical protein
MPILIGLFGFFIFLVFIYYVIIFAINNSQATKLLAEIRVLLMKSENNK